MRHPAKILAGALCCTLSFGQAVAESRLGEFRETLETLNPDQRMSRLEMGLNSDDGKIFLFALQQILSQQHTSALPLLEKALDPGLLHEDRREVVYVHYTRLRYANLESREDRSEFLLKLLASSTIREYPDLLSWAVEEFGNVGKAVNLEFFHRFEDLQWLQSGIRRLRIKLQLNTQYQRPALAALKAAQYPDPRIQAWAIDRLSRIDSRTAARFFNRWIEQHNLVSGRFLFQRFQAAREKHRKEFSHLYATPQNQKQ